MKLVVMVCNLVILVFWGVDCGFVFVVFGFGNYVEVLFKKGSIEFNVRFLLNFVVVLYSFYC